MKPRLLMIAVVTLASPVGALAQAVRFERKYPAGEKVLILSTEKLTQSIDMQFMKADTGVSGSKTTLVETSRRNDKGEFTRTHTLKAMKTEASMPGGMKLAFDSTKPDAAVAPQVPGAPGAGDQMLDSVKASMKAVRTFKFDKNNKLIGAKLSGLDLSNMPAAAAAEFGEQSMLKARQTQLDVLPQKPVKPGDTWTKKTITPLGAGQNLHQDIAYIYRGLAKRKGRMYDKIETKTIAAALKVEEGSPAQLKGSDLKPSPKSKGEIWFDREAGRIVASKAVIELDGTITIAAPTGEVEAGFKMKIESASEVKPTAGSSRSR